MPSAKKNNTEEVKTKVKETVTEKIKNTTNDTANEANKTASSVNSFMEKATKILKETTEEIFGKVNIDQDKIKEVSDSVLNKVKEVQNTVSDSVSSSVKSAKNVKGAKSAEEIKKRMTDTFSDVVEKAKNSKIVDSISNSSQVSKFNDVKQGLETKVEGIVKNVLSSLPLAKTDEIDALNRKITRLQKRIRNLEKSFVEEE